MIRKTVVITGGSKGIGKAIALKFASMQGRIIVISNDSQILLNEVKDEIEFLGGEALILPYNVTDFDRIQEGLKELDQVDVLVNNTSATCFTSTLNTNPIEFDKMIGTSVKAAFFLSKLCYDYLIKASNPHIINISPPLDLREKWFKDFLAFSISKYSMSLCTIGLAAEFKNISVNSLWPKTTIATQTIKDHFASDVYKASRWPTIMADSAYILANKNNFTGQFCIDEDLLKEAGITDFTKYAVDENSSLMQSLFIPDAAHLTPIKKSNFL